jgi:hypothetical protein
MRGWSRGRVRDYCKKHGWRVSVILQTEHDDVTASPIKPGITQHEESFEVVRPDGSTQFFYFDENAGRRAINGRLSKEAAFAAARAHLKRPT